MLSALAKYIFGGIMDEAPETTSMQYETREINDWLLVDMPDQDIDNEDMDSESEDDDILTAVPLLLAEEVTMSPRQIVLSYEANSSCDKSYAKIRKGFQDKNHSASSKVQVHSGDKIQGNVVDNVEDISLETENISISKVQHNLSEIQENIKTKQFKSKNSKPKKSKKNKNNKKFSIKIQNKSVIKKEHNDNVQEKSSDNILLNLNEDIHSVSNEIPENLDIKTECRLDDKVEDSHVAIADNCSHKHADKIEDFSTVIIDNSNQKNADKIEKDFLTGVIDSSSHRNADKTEDFPTVITNNANHKNSSICDNSFEKCGSKAQENVKNKISKHLDKKVQSNAIESENHLTDTSKRSYADVVKTKFDIVDKDCNKEVLVEKICINEAEFPEILLHDKTQDSQPKYKKSKSKKISKNKMQNAIDIKSQNIPIFVSVKCQDEFQENVNDKKSLFSTTALVSKVEEHSQDNFNDKSISDEDAGQSNIRTVDNCLTSQNISEDLQQNYTDKVLKVFNTSKTKISQVQQNKEVIQDSFSDNDDTALINVSTIFESKSQDMSNAQGTENTFFNNLNYNNAQNEDIQEDFTDDIYFCSSNNSDNENKVNFMDSCQILSRELDDNYHGKALDSFDFQQNLDDQVLENIADLWDIYTKIQENSDDEVHEISDDEMNENVNEDLQIISDREMTENSNEQITDDEMNENSLDEYEEISDEDLHGRSSGRIFQNLFGVENAKHYKRVFGYIPDEESEESDDEMFTNIQDHLVLPIIKIITESKPELLQPFKCNFLEELKQNTSEIPKHHSSCVPFAEYELVEYFNFEPEYFYACQSLQYPSSYALAIAEYYSNHDQYFPKYSERYNNFMQKCKRRAIVDNQTPTSPNEPSLITNSADLLQKIINQKCSALPTKTAVVLEHVKDLKPMQQAIQFEARKYMTRSQLNRQNRNYIYQSSSKTNRRRNLQRNPSGVNNNRKCC